MSGKSGATARMIRKMLSAAPLLEDVPRDVLDIDRQAEDEPTIDISVVASRMDVSEQTVMNWIRAGRLEAVEVRPYRFCVSEAVMEALFKPHVAPVRDRLCGVYFIGCREFVKIGLSADIHQRREFLQLSSPFDYELLHVIECASVPAAARLERAFHEQFKSSRHRREWFHLRPDVEPFLVRVRAKAEPAA